MSRHRHSRRLFLAPDLMSPPFTYSHDSSFDNNMVIILSALLCALIFILGLNSLIRCAIGNARRNTLGGQDLSSSECAPKGLKIEAVSKIPVVVFVSGVEICEVECPICLGEFDEGESIRILPTCNHGFHAMCIDKWLVSHSSCPMCRQHLFEQIA